MYVPLVILSVMAVAVAWTPVQGMLGGAIALTMLLLYRVRAARVSYILLLVLAVAAMAVPWLPLQLLLGLVVAVTLIVLWRRRAREEAARTPTHHVPHPDPHAVHAQPVEEHPALPESHAHAHGHEVAHEHEALPRWIGELPWALALAVFVFSAIWSVLAGDVVLVNLLEQARPTGTLAGAEGVLLEGWRWPSEHDAHAPQVVVPVSLIAIGTAFAGFLLATLMYGLRRLDPAEVRRQFAPVYRFLVNKWWFDELYDWTFVRPAHVVAGWAARFDRRWIDGFIDGTALVTRRFAKIWERVADRGIVDGTIDGLARWTYAAGISLRTVQTGNLRQYIVFIVVGAVAIFILISFFWNPTLAG